MANRLEIRLAGSGGQGIILASIILAQAAMQSGRNVAQTQSYGPEARGGACKAEVVVSDGPVGFFNVVKPNFLLALTQASLDKYATGLSGDCAVMIDESLTAPESLKAARLIRLPIIRTARETVGKAFTVNIVAVGAISRILPFTSPEELRQAVGLYIPKGTEGINFQALKAGLELYDV